MTAHLTPDLLSALADGELSAQQLAQANDHLAACPACTAQALEQSLLKSGVARAGKRYVLPPDLQQRLMRLTAAPAPRLAESGPALRASASLRFGLTGWAAAAVLLLAFGGTAIVEHNRHDAQVAAVREDALATEVFDQHVATLAASLPPQVVSTDRHTVKPWFQGKLPFSFNLPDALPDGTTLDGANLSYLRNQPVAQLLYSIGRHRVSVFVRQRTAPTAPDFNAEDAGFHVIVASSRDLEIAVVSDVDPARLSAFVTTFRQAQTEH
ncbi:MAG TPA: zf-HC2 domain-containing protein [Acidobacteriaceae bacterium]|jgi:anti-sigma factor RsiW|nr:zf-HC2 domain-containing protein [Acidobacteriaceae bacterium]